MREYFLPLNEENLELLARVAELPYKEINRYMDP